MSSVPSSNELQRSIEEIMKKKQYENFNEWVMNFASNLPFIWNEKSAKELNPELGEPFEKENHSTVLVSIKFQSFFYCF